MARFAKVVLTSVCVGVVLIAFIAPLIVRMQYTALSTGDRVLHTYAGFGYVEKVEDGKATVKLDRGGDVVVSEDELTEM